jgi:MFS family permease
LPLLDASVHVDDTSPVLTKIKDRNIWTVYAAILVLGIAYGISIALITHHLDVRGFNKTQMGSLASWFALGIVALSLPMGGMIRHFSAKTTLVASLAGYAASVSLFPSLQSFGAIACDRFLDGACSVGIWVSCETILLARAPRGMKAYVTTLYAVSIAIGYVVGPLAAHAIVGVTSIQRAFLVSGALATLATLIVVAFLDKEGPAVAEEAGGDAAAGERGPLTWLWPVMSRIKTSCFATFAYGYFQASVVLFLPLYLMEAKGTPREDTIIIPFFFALGMLLFSNLAGRYGDRYGHLLVMRVLGIVGTCMVVGFIFLQSYVLMAAAVFIAGASLAAISPVSLALQGVVTPPADYSRSNSVYNAFYAAGMLIGPKVSSVLFANYGGGVMLAHLALLWTAFVLFTVVFAGDDPAARRVLAPSGEPGEPAATT